MTCGEKTPIASPYFVQWCLSVCMFVCQVFMLIGYRLLDPSLRLTFTMKHRTLFLVSMLAYAGLFLSISASPPDRTPPMVQALLSLSLIPITLIVRRIALRKTVAGARIICTFAIMIGLVISTEPEIFHISPESQSTTRKGNHHVIWSLIFLLSFLPLSGLNVFSEHALKSKDSNGRPIIHPFVYLTWLLGYTALFTTMFVFVELIPGFGNASDFHHLGDQLKSGFRCMAGYGPPVANCSIYGNQDGYTMMSSSTDSSCVTQISRFWLLVCLFVGDNISSMLVIKYCDGAIYMAIVTSLKAPIGAIFWMLFHLDKDTARFSWRPHFDNASYFVLAGLVIMAPAALIYNWLSLKEDQPTSRSSSGRESSSSGRERSSLSERSTAMQCFACRC